MSRDSALGQNGALSKANVVNHFGTSGLSVAVATGVTHPLDVLKVRLQMQLVGQKGPLTGMGGLFVQALKNEGPRSLYMGLTPALTRSVLYGGLRLGLYEPSKYACGRAFGSTNFFFKIASGAFAGAVATALTNPVEVLKVRMQMNPELRSGGPSGELQKIVSEEGVRALWKGVGPAIARAAALTASQLATYDESKQILTSWTPLEEGFLLHLTSSTVAGTISTLITAPVDMVKTRLMLQKCSTGAESYKNGFHCAYQVMLKEGPRALYKGYCSAEPVIFLHNTNIHFSSGCLNFSRIISGGIILLPCLRFFPLGSQILKTTLVSFTLQETEIGCIRKTKRRKQQS